jgi:hypothetical protein
VLLLEDMDANYFGNKLFIGSVQQLVYSMARGPTLNNEFPIYSVSLLEFDKANEESIAAYVLNQKYLFISSATQTKLLDHLLVPFHRLQPLLPLVPAKPRSPFSIYAIQNSPRTLHTTLFGNKELHEEWSKLSPEQREPYVIASEENKKWWRRKTKLCEYFYAIKE